MITSVRPLTTEGERRKAGAIATLEAHRGEFIVRGRRALLRRLLDAGAATADDVRAGVELPPGIDPRAFGAVPGALAQPGIIRRAGYTETARAVAHARPVAVWELRDRAAALAWLAANPEPPAPREATEALSLFDLDLNATPDAATSGGR